MKQKNTYEYWVDMYISIPDYDADWVDSAATILSSSNNKMTKEEIEKYNTSQLKVIANAIKKPSENVDLSLLTPEYNATQMQLLCMAMDSGYDKELLKKLFNPNIPYAKLNYLIKGIIEGHGKIMQYFDYDADQIAEIYCAIADGLDLHWINKSLSAKKMSICRLAIKLGLEFIVLDNGALEVFDSSEIGED